MSPSCHSNLEFSLGSNETWMPTATESYSLSNQCEQNTASLGLPVLWDARKLIVSNYAMVIELLENAMFLSKK